MAFRSMLRPATPVYSHRKHRASKGTSTWTDLSWYRLLSATVSRFSKSMTDGGRALMSHVAELAAALPESAGQFVADEIRSHAPGRLARDAERNRRPASPC
jgi:hypothetical protein